MDELRRRVRALLERVREGEGAHVAADVAETLELWLTSGLLPLPKTLEKHAERLGALLGLLARVARPEHEAEPPADIPAAAIPMDRARIGLETRLDEVRAPSNAG